MNINSFLQKIKKEKPTPKWIFIFKAILAWFLFVLFIFIGIISISLIMYSIFNNDFNLDKTTFAIQIKLALSSLPYIWIIITALFFVISYFNIKKIENAYKILNIKNILITLTITFVLAVVFYNIGFAKFLDKNLQQNIPAYKNYINQHMFNTWNKPNDGFLIGKIIAINNNNEIILESYDNKKWTIIINENTIIKGKVSLSIYNGIKIIGKITDKNIFEAQEIRPETGMGKMQQNMK